MTSLARLSRADRRLLLWCALVAGLLLTPLSLFSDLEDAAGTGLDKPVHIVLFLVLGVLAMPAAAARTRHPLVAAVAGGVLYGVLLEAIQGLTGSRSAELLDVAADALGCGLGAAAASLRWWP